MQIIYMKAADFVCDLNRTICTVFLCIKQAKSGKMKRKAPTIYVNSGEREDQKLLISGSGSGTREIVMKKIILFVFAAAACVSLFFVIGHISAVRTDRTENYAVEAINPEEIDDVRQVTSVVETFGRRLRMVPLLASEMILTDRMQKYYGDLVTTDLIAYWIYSPRDAPGMIVSDPWPDHIEIHTVSAASGNRYMVTGKIVEVTNEAVQNGPAIARRDITLYLKNTAGGWRISNVQLGEYDQPAAQ